MQRADGITSGTRVLVPFDGTPIAQTALLAACQAAQDDGSIVIALYVLRVPRQLPLTAALPGLSHDLARVRLLAEQIGQHTGVAVWVDWVYARDVAPAIADVAEELEVEQILLGIRERRRLPGWLRPWSLAVQLPRFARCPVDVRTFAADAPRLRQRPAPVES